MGLGTGWKDALDNAKEAVAHKAQDIGKKLEREGKKAVREVGKEGVRVLNQFTDFIRGESSDRNCEPPINGKCEKEGFSLNEAGCCINLFKDGEL